MVPFFIYIKCAPGEVLLTKNRGNAQVVGYSNAVTATCELMLFKQLLQQLKLGVVKELKLICDNQAALHIDFVSILHERTKHIEIDCLFAERRFFHAR